MLLMFNRESMSKKGAVIFLFFAIVSSIFLAYCGNWRRDGTWAQIHERLRDWTRMEKERHNTISDNLCYNRCEKE